jgi:general secretion pathway protein C
MKKIFYLNIAFALLVSAVIAKIASDFIAYRISHTFAVRGKKTSTPLASAPAEDLQAFAPILEKGLFGKAAQGKLTPVAQKQTAATGGVSRGDLLLLGTAVGSFRETFALIQRTSTKEERVFRLGDQVYDLGPLVKVTKESAEIQANGNRITVMTPTAVAAEGGGTARPAPVAGTLASQVGAGSYVIDQNALNAALDNIGQAMTDARLLPSVKDGKVEGFRVSEVKPAGIFGMVGIRNGDVLLRINDFPIDSPEKAIQAFVSLKGQSRIKLDLVRDGQPASFNYDIR